ARTKDSIPTFVEQLPIPNNVTAVVGLIGHHNDYRITRHLLEASNNSPSKAVKPEILHRVKCRYSMSQLCKHLPGSICTSVIDHNNLMWNIVQAKLYKQMLYG